MDSPDNAVSLVRGARVVPIKKSKYYGTDVEIEHELGTTTITIWFRNSSPPSAAELEPYTQEDWENNVPIRDGWGGGGLTPIRFADYIDYSHHQTQYELDLAHEIVRRLNGG